MKCIVGLGNPGKEYEKTRHNVGFMVVDAIAKELKLDFKKKFSADIAKGSYNGETIVLVKPLTYMNNSGDAVRMVTDFYQIDHEDIIIVYDDMDLPIGKIRLRQKGGAGGHNGIKSIIAHLNHQIFKRLRIGIGSIEKDDVIKHVLGNFSKEEKAMIEKQVDKAKLACLDFARMDFVDLMTRYNTGE